MGIYIFTWDKLKEYLIRDEQDGSSGHDFGANILPEMIAQGEKMMAYRFDGYWKDVGTIESFWEANGFAQSQNPSESVRPRLEDLFTL